jgi:hypothetical protein
MGLCLLLTKKGKARTEETYETQETQPDGCGGCTVEVESPALIMHRREYNLI